MAPRSLADTVHCIMQFDDFFCYKDIGSKAFFTMATLLMALLGNELSQVYLITMNPSQFRQKCQELNQ